MDGIEDHLWVRWKKEESVRLEKGMAQWMDEEMMLPVSWGNETGKKREHERYIFFKKKKYWKERESG